MKNLTLSVLVLSIFAAQYAMADNLAVDEALAAGIEAQTTASRESAQVTAEDIKVNGGYVKIGRDGRISVVSNGPTIGQRLYLVGAEIKRGVLYLTYSAYSGARAADGAVVGTITYPFMKVGEWMNTPKTAEVAKAEAKPEAAPALKAEEVKPETAPAPAAEPEVKDTVAPATTATT